MAGSEMRILGFEDLAKIANAIYDLGYSEDCLTVNIPVPNKMLLDRINEEYHYRFGMEGEADTSVDEVNITIGPTSFKYYIEDRELEQ